MCAWAILICAAVTVEDSLGSLPNPAAETFEFQRTDGVTGNTPNNEDDEPCACDSRLGYPGGEIRCGPHAVPRRYYARHPFFAEFAGSPEGDGAPELEAQDCGAGPDTSGQLVMGNIQMIFGNDDFVVEHGNDLACWYRIPVPVNPYPAHARPVVEAKDLKLLGYAKRTTEFRAILQYWPGHPWTDGVLGEEVASYSKRIAGDTGGWYRERITTVESAAFHYHVADQGPQWIDLLLTMNVDEAAPADALFELRQIITYLGIQNQ